MDGSSFPLDLSQSASTSHHPSKPNEVPSTPVRKESEHASPSQNAPLDLTKTSPEHSFMISQILKPVLEPKPVSMVSEQNPVSLVSEQKRLSMVSEQKPLSLVSKQKPVSLVSEQKPVSLVSEQKPVCLVSKQKPLSLVSEQKQVSLASEKKPVSLLSEEKPISMVSEQNPVSLVSEQKPVSLVSEQKPVSLALEQKPVSLVSEQKTASSNERETVVKHCVAENPQSNVLKTASTGERESVVKELVRETTRTVHDDSRSIAVLPSLEQRETVVKHVVKDTFSVRHGDAQTIVSPAVCAESCSPVPEIVKETPVYERVPISYVGKELASENKDSVVKQLVKETPCTEASTCNVRESEQLSGAKTMQENTDGQIDTSITPVAQDNLNLAELEEHVKKDIPADYVEDVPDIKSDLCHEKTYCPDQNIAKGVIHPVISPPLETDSLEKSKDGDKKSEDVTETPEEHSSSKPQSIDKIECIGENGDKSKLMSAIAMESDIEGKEDVQKVHEHENLEPTDRMEVDDNDGITEKASEKSTANLVTENLMKEIVPDVKGVDQEMLGSTSKDQEQISQPGGPPPLADNISIEESLKIGKESEPYISDKDNEPTESAASEFPVDRLGGHTEETGMETDDLPQNSGSQSILATESDSLKEVSEEPDTLQEKGPEGDGKNENEEDVGKVEEEQCEDSKGATDANVDGRSTPKPKKRRGSTGSAPDQEEEDSESQKVTAEKLFEYQWPQERGGEWFMLQEQVSEYLGVLSFKRKHPDLQRRPVEMQERIFLQEKGVVTETQCDLGLTALKSEEVCELMMKDYNEKYQDYAEVLQERERKKMKESQKNYQMPKLEKSKMDFFMKKAIKSAAEYNSNFLREKREERRAYLDLQTQEVHFPQGKMKKLPPECTKVGAYPVALIPGQYQDYYKTYEPQQLKYFPINTAVYDSPRALKNIYADPNEATESEEEEGTNGSSSGEDSGSSGSSSSDGDSDQESPKEQEEESKAKTPAMTPAPTQTPKGTPRRKQSSDEAQEAPVEVKVEPGKAAAPLCNVCSGTSEKNKLGEAEELVKCSECSKYGHPSCIELTSEMIPIIHTYKWQCMECKTCVECMDPYDEDKMMFCDHCDRGYHTFCVGLRSIPTGRWECPSCRPDQPPPKKRGRTR